ncbi:beta-1%2C3-galactosyltransferase 2-like [Xyrichtys novacula]|uniref:Hexosyltransferase n=1 Tax=Xyrichtys novacula TaxID=13765 RepID=A0AAV1G452_XYRNO|nr:beta-1%2C3-galactosyltransferase 2-like [Xyrichtys novacula]
MKVTYSLRLVKLVAVSVVLVLFAQILLNRVNKLSKHPKFSPLTEEEYRVISPKTYSYILNQPLVCKDRNPFLVFMVPVTPQDVAAREAIRKTWGAPGQDTLTLFFVGLPEGGQRSSTSGELEKESGEHADIIQMNFQESYQNLTIKTMMMMNWLATHCPNASYAMKVDSDIFVNVFYLIRRLWSSPRQEFITGSVIRDGKPKRDVHNKWRVSEELYPQDSFPPYLSGAGYVFSADLAARISWASRFVRMIPLEDVYVGLCLHVLGVNPVYSRSLPTFRNLFEIRNLEYDSYSPISNTLTSLPAAAELQPVSSNSWVEFHPPTRCLFHHGINPSSKLQKPENIARTLQETLPEEKC